MANFTQCNIPECRVGMFKPDPRTRATGPMRVHTFGGGTWVSEFATDILRKVTKKRYSRPPGSA